MAQGEHTKDVIEQRGTADGTKPYLGCIVKVHMGLPNYSSYELELTYGGIPKDRFYEELEEMRPLGAFLMVATDADAGAAIESGFGKEVAAEHSLAFLRELIKRLENGKK